MELTKRKRDILDIALKLFAQKGYSSTSMNDIAEEVGIRKATMYSHFKNKESILQILIDLIIDNHIKELFKIFRETEGQRSIERLRSIFYKYIYNCRNNIEVDFWTRFYYYPPESQKEYILSKTHDYEKIFNDKLLEIIESGIKNNEIVEKPVKDIMISYYYLLLGFVMSLNFYIGKEVDEDIEKCVSVFLDGIKK